MIGPQWSRPKMSAWTHLIRPLWTSVPDTSQVSSEGMIIAADAIKVATVDDINVAPIITFDAPSGARSTPSPEPSGNTDAVFDHSRRDLARLCGHSLSTATVVTSDRLDKRRARTMGATVQRSRSPRTSPYIRLGYWSTSDGETSGVLDSKSAEDLRQPQVTRRDGDLVSQSRVRRFQWRRMS